MILTFRVPSLYGRAITKKGIPFAVVTKMQERLEAAFEYSMDHPEALMLICGTIFGLASALTVSFDVSTTSFLRVMSIGLIACGILFYVLRLGLRFIIRVFHKLFHMRITFDDNTNNN
jgi:hypothetical protein